MSVLRDLTITLGVTTYRVSGVRVHAAGGILRILGWDRITTERFGEAKTVWPAENQRERIHLELRETLRDESDRIAEQCFDLADAAARKARDRRAAGRLDRYEAGAHADARGDADEVAEQGHADAMRRFK